MSVLLIVVGAIVLVAGVGMIGFGIPINEFSFGNTLIASGTTAAIGGLVLIGLGAVVAQLQRITDALAMWTPVQPGARMPEPAEAVAAEPRAAGRPPFPRRPATKPEPQPALATVPDRAPLSEPDTTQGISQPAESAMAAMAAPPVEHPSIAPSLHNPDIPPLDTRDEVSLSPVQPPASSPPAPEKVAKSEPPRATPRPLFGFNQPRQSLPPAPPEVPPPMAAEPPASEFDEMWPAFEPKSGPPAAEEDSRVEPTLDRLPPPAQEQEPVDMDAATSPSEPPRAVAILKSGVVDGMGYTLYVDGSIEAELPQGTLRFSSINDLRNYLEKNS